jgi:transcriptional regulator GlxA family with amidase domain
LRISHWQLRDKPTYELVRGFDTHQQKPQELVGLILPPNLNADPQGEAIPELQRWVETQHASGCIVCSVCGGAFLLAKTGLLNGRSATTLVAEACNHPNLLVIPFRAGLIRCAA